MHGEEAVHRGPLPPPLGRVSARSVYAERSRVARCLPVLAGHAARTCVVRGRRGWSGRRQGQGPRLGRDGRVPALESGVRVGWRLTELQRAPRASRSREVDESRGRGLTLCDWTDTAIGRLVATTSRRRGQLAGDGARVPACHPYARINRYGFVVRTSGRRPARGQAAGTSHTATITSDGTRKLELLSCVNNVPMTVQTLLECCNSTRHTLSRRTQESRDGVTSHPRRPPAICLALCLCCASCRGAAGWCNDRRARCVCASLRFRLPLLA